MTWYSSSKVSDVPFNMCTDNVIQIIKQKIQSKINKKQHKTKFRHLLQHSAWKRSGLGNKTVKCQKKILEK